MRYTIYYVSYGAPFTSQHESLEMALKEFELLKKCQTVNAAQIVQVILEHKKEYGNNNKKTDNSDSKGVNNSVDLETFKKRCGKSEIVSELQSELALKD